MAYCNMISPFSLQAAQLDESPEKILLSPTDPNAEVAQITGYKLVYVNGACPRTYRVYNNLRHGFKSWHKLPSYWFAKMEKTTTRAIIWQYR